MHKIKKYDIIRELYCMITLKMIEQDIKNPVDVEIALDDLKTFLNEKLNANLHSEQHVYQQIRSYEREKSVALFKRKNKNGALYIKLESPTRYYQEKQLLHINLKIAITNGAYDLITNIYQNEMHYRPLNIFLGAGAESYYLADIFFNKHPFQVNIYTHNLAVIDLYVKDYLKLNKVNLFTRYGKVDKESLALFEQSEDLYKQTAFDAIVGSTTFIDKKGLYIESAEEHVHKSKVFSMLQGLKILLLTLFEFQIPKNIKKYRFSSIEDFEYLIVPSSKVTSKLHEYLAMIPFIPEISFFTYEIFKNIHR